ncbi:MAG: LamG-like jellyroll fold domain-containing protein [Planctomycetota bacterium]|nr:LamG-like jellyroll fold domain-containing protein [Planctomycetota bacterium]
MSQTKLCVALAVVLCTQAGAQAQEVPQTESIKPTAPARKPLKRLFYLPFDDKVDATEASGSAKATVVGDVTRVAGKRGKGALFVNNAHLAFAAEKNFDQNEGTLSMWLKPQWDNNDGRAHCLFEVPRLSEGGVAFPEGFIITKGWTNTVGNSLLYFASVPPWYHINPEVSFAGGTWIHLIFTWSTKAGSFAVYTNGLLAQPLGLNSKLPRYPDSQGRKIFIGARVSGVTAPADAVIDELQIFDRMVTAQEAWLLAGGKGPPPELSAPLLPPDRLTTLPHDLITPHVAFARPLKGGPVKALFLTPQLLARDVVELWQRFDLEYDAFLLLGYSGAKWTYDPGAYARRYFSGISQKEIEEDLLEKLDRNPQVIVMSDVELAQTPPAAREKILNLVKGGRGLVMTSRAIPPGSPFFEQEDPAGLEAISAGIPWAGLPELFPGEGISASQLPAKTIAAYRCGKGRVVAVRFRSEPIPSQGGIAEDGLTPCLYHASYSREWDERYGRYLSLVAKAVLWASARDIQWKLSIPADGSQFARTGLPKERGLTFQVTSTEPGTGNLHVEIRDTLGRVELTRTAPVQVQEGGGITTLTQAIPTLKTGLHYVDARLLIAGKTAAWGSMAFHVTAPEEILTVALDQESVERGDELNGKVTLAGSPGEPTELRVQAIDTNGRVYAQTRQKIPAASNSIPFAIRLDDPTTIASYIEAEVVRGQEVLSQKAAPAFVPKRNMHALDADEFPHLNWGPWIPTSGPGMVEARQLRKAGFNISLAGPIAKNVMNIRNGALWDRATLVYAIHLVIAGADAQGWPKLQSWYPEEIKDGSYANPQVKEHAWQSLKGRLGDVKNYGPFFYSLGDECVYRGEFGFSPWGMKAYRKYLASQYGNIDRLNQEWGANYNGFEEVPRLKPEEAKAKRHVPALLAHQDTKEMVWREMFVFLRQKIRDEYDPRALVGVEGSETHDLEAMVSALDVWAPYTNLASDVLGRCVSKPGSISGHWYGSYLELQASRAAAAPNWYELFRGFGSVGFYYIGGASSDGNLMADLSYTDFFKTQLPDFELLHSGVGQLLRTCKPKSAGVAIHWSQASRLGLEAADEFGTPAGASGALMGILEKESIVNWDFITGRQLEKQPELAMRQRVIFLPVSQCLADGEAATLKAFVNNGGLLVGIGPVGNRSIFGRELDEGQLDDVFGVRMKAPARVLEVRNLKTSFSWRERDLALESGSNRVNQSITVTGAKTLAEASGVPLAVANSYGEGTALLLNLDLALCDHDALTETMLWILEGAGVSARMRFDPEPGPGGRCGVLARGDLTLLGVITDHRLPGEAATVGFDRPGRWKGGKVILPEPTHVYDVKAGKYLGELKEIAVSANRDMQGAALFALQRERIKDVVITVPEVIERDRQVTIGCEVRAAGTLSCEGRVVRIELRAPDGRVYTHYRRMAHLKKGGRGDVTAEFALNDPTGRWTIQATDVATGTKTSVVVNVK